MAIATERKSTLAVKLELASITPTATGSGTTITFSASHGLAVGDVIGNPTKGYRTIVSVTSATVVEVDSAFITALSTDTVNKQNYGVDPTIGATDVIEFVPPFTFEPDRAEITRNVVNRSYDEIEPIMGQESVAGDISIELHGSGTAAQAPESDPLWQCAIGEVDASQSSTTHATTPCTTTSVVLVASGGAKFKVGHHIVIDIGGTYEVSRVTAIATDTLTVSPAFSVAPAVSKAVGAGIHYKPTLTELHSIWSPFWRGDITKETYKGNKCAGLALDFKAGQATNPKFSFKGKETGAPVAGAYTLGTPAYDTGKANIGRYMVVKVGGVLYPVSDVSINVANDLFERTDVTKSGIHSLIRTKRTITGSFSLLYENKDIEDVFRAGTTAELMIVSSAGDINLTLGNIFVLSLPKIKYTKVPKSVDSGLYKYDVTFKAVRQSGEDSIFVSFL